jgi:hypothetical protein
MGVDCRLEMPGYVEVRDVAKAIGKLLGCKSIQEELGWGRPTRVDGVRVRNSSVVGLAEIDVVTPVLRWLLLYHFQGNGGTRAILMRSRAKHIALLKRLADVFGGTVDFDDCDETRADHVAPERPEKFCFGGDDPDASSAAWTAWQDELHAMEPLTEDEIAAFEQYAAYQGRP